MQLSVLDALNPNQAFPSLDKALGEPNGLIAVGGCLSPQRILNAYRNGIFPWFNPGEPILWWSPDPRLVLFPDKLQVSRSLRKTLRKQLFEIRYDSAFEQVIIACAAPRGDQGGTWITEDMKRAYLQLHKLGIAHSVEAWQDQQLVGGLYGIGIGRVFFGESMFHRKTDASKVVFAHLVRQLTDWHYQLIDCQVSSEHLFSLGAEEVPRTVFADLLNRLCELQPDPDAWRR
ncbi:leucyl/phenylalanyl-tRNA--protein transferase [Methylomonas methanica]|uniref:Leucyl/phenylalanyl-tRNA--protein transferase n=1 Tax=Methylomonas methanica (strain DSM 25384 / MC09) TaxID=857087 RepID=G0A2Q3_METMM|nr:leucyl/phenylalanyl-tRNA--protein transferase [Methylomonas methanica]AEG01406.1 Leucyl/phenylalanyl-tRNA--protein transferase [Methylomonas methanica MC09]